LFALMTAATETRGWSRLSNQFCVFFELRALSYVSMPANEPATVATAVVAAATSKKPKLRYTADSRAARVSTLRRLVPAGAFDKQIRKLPARRLTPNLHSNDAAPQSDNEHVKWPVVVTAQYGSSMPVTRRIRFRRIRRANVSDGALHSAVLRSFCGDACRLDQR
jgi:hypothetical protein